MSLLDGVSGYSPVYEGNTGDPVRSAGANKIKCIYTYATAPGVSEAAETEEVQKEPRGKKSGTFKENLINKYKDKYEIKAETRYTMEGHKPYTMYYITAKSDVKLSELKKDLGISDGVIVKHNDKNEYGRWGDNGGYVENKQMKGHTIKIPLDQLGYELDERNIFEQIYDSITGLF